MRKLWPFLGIALAVAIGIAIAPFLLGALGWVGLIAYVAVSRLWRLAAFLVGLGIVLGLTSALWRRVTGGSRGVSPLD